MNIERQVLSKNMSFSKKVKEQIYEIIPSARHCQIAELFALFSVCGEIETDENNNKFLSFKTENLTVAKKSYMLLWKVFHVHIDVTVRCHSTSKSTLSYYIYVKDDGEVDEVLKTLKLDDFKAFSGGEDLLSVSRLLQSTCCKKSFVRGIFLATGSVTNPDKAYHLELVLQSESYAEYIKSILEVFGLTAKLISRKNNFVIYLKEGSQIVDFLNIIQAHQALMDFENVRILKEVRNSVNRQVNCETANITKTVEAAAKQIEDIKYIECNMGFGKLNDDLRRTAQLRIDNPDASLQELADMLGGSISKSGVNHRLHRLSDIADKFKKG